MRDSVNDGDHDGVVRIFVSLVPRCSVIGEKSAWYPLFTHARAVPLQSPYNSSRYVS